VEEENAVLADTVLDLTPVTAATAVTIGLFAQYVKKLSKDRTP